MRTLGRIKKEDIKLMYDTCKELGEKGLSTEVRKEYGNFALTMTVWRWKAVRMQVSPFGFAGFDEAKKDTNVCGFTFKFTPYEDDDFGGYYSIKEVSEDDFVRVLEG